MWDAVAIALKTFDYAATFAAAGAVLFVGCCHRCMTARELAAARRLVGRAWGASVTAGALRILTTAGSLGGDASGMLSPPLLAMAWQSGQGASFALRATSLTLAAFSLRDGPPRAWTLAAAAVSAMSFALAGHARALGQPAWPLALQGIHLLGVAFWVGSLLPLASLARGAELVRVAEAALRFSAAALWAVGALIVAGVILLVALLGRPSALWESAYGRLLTAKLVWVAALLGLAALNKWRLTPRLEAGDAAAARGLIRSIRAEMALALLILAVTATLTTVTGPAA